MTTVRISWLDPGTKQDYVGLLGTEALLCPPFLSFLIKNLY